MIYRYLRRFLQSMGGAMHFLVLVLAAMVIMLAVWIAVLELGIFI